MESPVFCVSTRILRQRKHLFLRYSRRKNEPTTSIQKFHTCRVVFEITLYYHVTLCRNVAFSSKIHFQGKPKTHFVHANTQKHTFISKQPFLEFFRLFRSDFSFLRRFLSLRLSLQFSIIFAYFHRSLFFTFSASTTQTLGIS